MMRRVTHIIRWPIRAYVGLENAPIWLLRAIVVVAGVITVTGLAFLIVALSFDYGPPVSIEVQNHTAHDAQALLDGEPPVEIAGFEAVDIVREDDGAHEIGVVSDEPGAVAVTLHFESDPTTGTDLVIEVLPASGPPLRR